MLYYFDQFRELTTLAITLRLVLAVICGGIIGMERTYRRRPAGFRTHILICLGATVTTLTSQYLYLVMHYYTDMARLGAQVIAGIGFLGAGTITITRRQQVKGLSTAAGMWSVAIIGLAIGGGFYEGAIITTLMIFLVELIFSQFEYKRSLEINLYMEYTDHPCLEKILKYYRKENLEILNVEITRSHANEEYNACAIFSLRLHKHCNVDQVMNYINSTPGVVSVEEL